MHVENPPPVSKAENPGKTITISFPVFNIPLIILHNLKQNTHAFVAAFFQVLYVDFNPRFHPENYFDNILSKS